jgi:hypothetical protein
VTQLERNGGSGAASVPSKVMADRLKRLERLVVRVYNRKAKARGADGVDLERVRRSIGQLARRLETVESQRGSRVKEKQAMGEVKGLLKTFFNDFSRRMQKVEKQVF